MGNNESKKKPKHAPLASNTVVRQSERLRIDLERIRKINYLISLPKFNRKIDYFGEFAQKFIDELTNINAKLDVKTSKAIFEDLFENEEDLRLYHSIPDELKWNDDWEGYFSALLRAFDAGIDGICTTHGRSIHKCHEAGRRELEANEDDNMSGFFLRDDEEDNVSGLFPLDDDEICQINALSVKNVSKSICYFALERIQPIETLAREKHSEVSTDCEGELTSMIDLVEKRSSQFGTVNELELVLARGAGLFADVTSRYAERNFIGQFICNHHLNELSRRWKSKEWQRHIRKKTKTNGEITICGITTHEKDISNRIHYLNKAQAHKYLHHKHRLYHVGLAICHEHVEEIDNMPDVEIGSPASSVEPMDTEFDTTNPEMVAADRRVLEELFAAFAEKAGVNRITPSLDFGYLERDTKMRRVYAMKKLVKVMASIVAPNDQDELMRLYIESLVPNAWMECSENKWAKIFEVVAKQYEKTEDRRGKEIILSSIVNIIGLKELQNYIPGLSSRKYHNASIRAKSTVPIVPIAIKRSRYEPIRLHYFISFITSPIVSTGLPYGERKVKTSDGSSVSIPNTIRLHRNAEIIRMYKKHMEDIGKKHLIIKDTVAYGILKKCSATRRHALTCVDYYLADGADAFEDIDDILSSLQGMALLDPDMAKLWKYNVAQSKLYLKTDFRMHLKMESKVIEHCYLHSLSDTSDRAFEYKGECHSHTVRCPRCVMMESTFNEIQSLLERLDKSMDSSNATKKTVSEMIIRMKQDVERIVEMKMHLVRAGYTDLERTRIINELEDGDAFVTMDFAQKYLPTYKWESQRKYFGKRGMPWHVFHVIAKINGEYVQHSIVHVLYTKKQDNHTVAQMLGHVLSKLRKVKITRVHLRADNAGAYHSLGTIASIPHLAEKNGVKVSSISFSEAQNGKSSCDRVAAQVKRKLSDYVARGKNITKAKDLYEGIAASGLRGLSVYLARVKREKTEKAENALSKTLRPKMDGISAYGHFSFDGNTVRTWKMHGIGEGKLYTDLSGFKREIKIEEEGGFLASEENAEGDEAMMKKGENPERFWTSYLSKKEKVTEEPDDVDEIGPQGQEIHGGDNTGVFTCNECGATYLKYGNLLRHLDIGRHRIRPEKIHLYDYALQLFKRNLEDIQAHNNILAEVSEAMTEMENGKDHSFKQGWALKGKRKRVIYSERAKAFAQKLFDQGEASGRKMDPPEVERLMKEDNSIKPFERMNAQQIRSFFGSLSKAKKAAKVTKRRGRNVAVEEEVEYDESDDDEYEDLSEEYEENIDDFGRDITDVIHDIIREDFNDLFTDEVFVDEED